MAEEQVEEKLDEEKVETAEEDDEFADVELEAPQCNRDGTECESCQ